MSGVGAEMIPLAANRLAPLPARFVQPEWKLGPASGSLLLGHGDWLLLHVMPGVATRILAEGELQV